MSGAKDATTRLPEIVIGEPRVLDAQAQAELRAPFPAELVGMRPLFTCEVCRKAPGRCCNEHPRRQCSQCGGYLSVAHMHLDFVGHAHVTDRLLQVDPGWEWEPLAYDERGLPALDQFGGMWIRLTICGKTRIGYGAADGKTGPNAIKETIGDAIKVTAMRFGVGLDLWQGEPAPGRMLGQEHPVGEEAQKALSTAFDCRATMSPVDALDAVRDIWTAHKVFLDDIATPNGHTLRARLTQLLAELDQVVRRQQSMSGQG
ncbi:hypothetical protein ACIBG8_54580 [Nonomuraea sp. NPDC050556]|uniref:hypothetical protein n=1 Tax=Nonomuraea sp. NPDC050556 TaxID=3364369 RepID=UPI0037913FF6